MLLAWRNLFQDKTRLILSTAGVALSVMLILILNGFLSGVYQQVAAYLNNTPGTVVVAQAGADNFLGRVSLLPVGTTESVRKTPGVSKSVPVLTQTFIIDLRGTKLGIFAVGYEPALGGGPWRLAQGREIQTNEEVILDYALALQRNIAVGDLLNIAGRNFTIVGLSEDTTTWALAYLFMRKPVLETLMLSPGATSYVLITPSPGVTSEELQDQLQRSLPGTNVLLKGEVIDNDSKLLASVYGPPLQLMVGIAFLVGVLVVGLVIYTATVERQQEYGVLKAIGAHNSLLYRVVTVQALLAAGVGAVVGVGLAFGLAQLIMRWRPSFTVVIEPAAIVVALMAGVVIAVLASFVPTWSIAKLAPAEVFKR